MRLAVSISFFVLSTSIVAGQPTIVPDPIASYIPKTLADTARIFKFSTAILVKCPFDFNNDGLTDLAISDHEDWGNQGGTWQIWLAQNDGKYRLLGDLGFHPLGINVKPEGPHVARVTIYQGSGIYGGTLTEYLITDTAITEVKATEMPPDSTTNGSGPSEPFSRLFIDDTTHLPLVYCCRIKDLFFNRSATWRDGYYISPKEH